MYRAARAAVGNPYADRPPCTKLGRVWVPDDVLDDVKTNGRALRKELIKLAVEGKPLSYSNLASLCHIAHLAGCCGVEDIGYDSRGHSGNASRHVDLIIAREYHAPHMYYCPTWVQNKSLGIREELSIPMRLPHSFLDDCHINDVDPGGSDDNVHTQIETYKNHDVVLSAGAANLEWWKLIPVSLYFDWVKYKNTDSVLGIYFHDLRKDMRYLCVALRRTLSSFGTLLFFEEGGFHI